ncbi:hypothetical protein ACIRG5_35290 [Lentzea sp. NPDC102401]|uniref:hypothetical protein n=1 Tax=Lentzea sp. NPDC102401 TaxID=3364128 RepID=UPI00381C1646
MNVHRKRRAAGLAAAALGVVALLGAAGPAGAAPAADTTGIQIEAVSSDTPVMVSDLTDIDASAVYYCAVRDNTFGCQSGSPGDGLVVARLYHDPNFGGSEVVVFNPAYQVGCSSSTTDNEGGAPLGGAGNNLISSVRTYNSCDVKLFDGTGGTGTASAWLDNAGTLGAWDNRAGSFKIS